MADTATTFAGIHNENEFYSHHYLSEIFTGDIRDTVARWRDTADAAGGASAGARTPPDALRALARDYLQFRRQFAHARQHEARVRRQRRWFALARLDCPLPDRRDGADGHSTEALAACGTILYWLNRVDFDETTRRDACDASLGVLVRHERGAALDVLRHCEYTLVEGVQRLPGPVPVERSIVNCFPCEAAEICRHALAGPVCQVGYFRHFSDHDRQQNLTFAIDVLARHGNSTDLRLLRAYANNAALGTSAIAAVRAIEERMAAA